jgi:hypothetical protein
MAEEGKAPGIDALIGAIVELVQVKEKGETRGGPLLVAGRLYLSLTLILAVVTSASGYLDSKSLPTSSVLVLRYTLLVCILAGLYIAVQTVRALYKKNPLFIFSPTELSTQAQASLIAPVTPDEEPKEPETEKPGTATKDPPAGRPSA